MSVVNSYEYEFGFGIILLMLMYITPIIWALDHNYSALIKTFRGIYLLLIYPFLIAVNLYVNMNKYDLFLILYKEIVFIIIFGLNLIPSIIYFHIIYTISMNNLDCFKICASIPLMFIAINILQHL